MSGGGNSQPKPIPATPSGPYPGKGVPYSMPQAAPGQLQTIAGQLADGYGQGLPGMSIGAPEMQIMDYLDSMYSPMDILRFPQPMPAAPAVPAAALKAASKAVANKAAANRQASSVPVVRRTTGAEK